MSMGAAAVAKVVVVGPLEREMRSGEVLVKFPYRPHFCEPLDWESAGMRRRLAPHPGLQSAHEVPLIDEVLAAFERAHALVELDDR